MNAEEWGREKYPGWDKAGKQYREDLMEAFNDGVASTKEAPDDTDFNGFWGAYHDITGLPMSDKEAARRYWKALSGVQKNKAVESIYPYFNSLKDKKYCKKARTYLRDRNFNDEFKPVKQNEWGDW